MRISLATRRSMPASDGPATPRSGGSKPASLTSIRSRVAPVPAEDHSLLHPESGIRPARLADLRDESYT